MQPCLQATIQGLRSLLAPAKLHEDRVRQQYVSDPPGVRARRRGGEEKTVPIVLRERCVAEPQTIQLPGGRGLQRRKCLHCLLIVGVEVAKARVEHAGMESGGHRQKEACGLFGRSLAARDWPQGASPEGHVALPFGGCSTVRTRALAGQVDALLRAAKGARDVCVLIA